MAKSTNVGWCLALDAVRLFSMICSNGIGVQRSHAVIRKPAPLEARVGTAPLEAWVGTHNRPAEGSSVSIHSNAGTVMTLGKFERELKCALPWRSARFFSCPQSTGCPL